MSSGSQSYIAIVPADKNDPKAVPTGTGEKINFTGDSLDAGIKTTKSKSIRPDRMLAGVTVTGMDIGGGFDFEEIFEEDKDDKLMASAVWGKWNDLLKATPGPVAVDAGTLTKATGILDLSGATTKPDNIEAGVMVHLTGTANQGANDGFYTLAPVAGQADQYNMTPKPAADETLAAGAKLSGQWLKNGSEYQPMFIERGHVDVGQYFQFMGMGIDKWSMEIADQSIITGKFEFVGFTSAIKQAPTFSQYTDQSVNPAISSVTNIPQIFMDGVSIPVCTVNKFSFEASNNLKGKTGVGVFGNCATTAHQFEVTGKLTMFFENEVQYNRLLKGTEFSFGWMLVDNVGNAYSFLLPRCRMSEDKINVKGVDSDVLDDAKFMSLADNVTKAAIIVCRFPKA